MVSYEELRKEAIDCPKAERAVCPVLSLWKDPENGLNLPGSPRCSIEK